MKRATVLLFAIAIVVAACSSSDPYEPPQGERGRGMGQGGGYRGAAAGGGAGMLELLPPANWWRDERMANAVNLKTDQVAALDKIYSDEGDDIARLINDSQVAVRQLRDSLALEQPKSEDISSAGQRLRSLRDDIFDRQLRMLGEERLVLSTQQWTALQNELQNARSQRQQDRRGGYPGGAAAVAGWADAGRGGDTDRAGSE